MSENVSNYPLLGQHDQKDNYGIYLGQTKISISSVSTVGSNNLKTLHYVRNENVGISYLIVRKPNLTDFIN